MRYTRTHTAAVVAAVAATLALTSCSSAETPADAPETTEAAPSEEPTAEETPMEEEMAETAALMPTGTGDPFVDARTAASHMPQTALALATGLAAATGTAGEVDSPAAALRAGLTSLLQEHVYLAGIAVNTAYVAGADSAEFGLAAAALDANSVALSEAVGSLAGEEKGAQFLESWREHVGYFVNYAVAAKGGDQAGKDGAVADLQGYAGRAGQFFEEISAGNLPAAAIQESFNAHIGTLTAAIDAMAAGDPAAYGLLQDAAAHMGMAAATIAGGLDTALELEGDPNDAASGLRSGLTDLLQEHMYLAGIAVFTAYTTEGSIEGPAFTAAAGVLDENSVALSAAVSSLAGEEQGAAFLETWREHIGYFVDYAVAAAGDDQAGKDSAIVDLQGYSVQAGAFFEEVTGGELPADAVTAELEHHIETLAGAIDSMKAALVG